MLQWFDGSSGAGVKDTMREPVFSIRHTVIITLVISTTCAILVVAASNLLKPRQLAWLAIEMNRSIVAAMIPALEAVDELTAGEVVQRFGELEVRLIDLNTGDESNAFDPLLYNVFTATENPELGYKIAPELDIAGLVQRPTFAPVYRIYQDERLQRVGLPVYGPGMWSTIAAYVVLESDYNTIANIYFYQHGETPGIGDQIESLQWRQHWVGKKIRNPAGEFKFQERKSAQDKYGDNYQIDAISGATVTSSSVVSIVQYWLGDDGYGPYLGKQREDLAQ